MGFHPKTMRSVKRSAGAAGIGTARAVRRMVRPRVSLKFKFKKKSSVRDAPLMTFQHDSRWEYKRRPAPRRVKVHAKRFNNKVTRVIESKFPIQNYRFANAFSQGSLSGNSGFFSIPIYSGYAVDASGVQTATEWNQLGTIFNAYVGTGTLNASGVPLQYDAKIQFQSCVSDIQIVNITQAVGGFNATALVSVYHVTARKDTPQTGDQLLSNGITSIVNGNALIPPVGNNSLFANIIGAQVVSTGITPFNSPDFCKHYIVKNKRTVTMSPGQTLRLQMKDPREYNISWRELVQNEFNGTSAGGQLPVGMATLRKYTEAYLIIYHGAPGDMASNGASQAIQLSVSYYNMYRFRLITPEVAALSSWKGNCSNIGSEATNRSNL